MTARAQHAYRSSLPQEGPRTRWRVQCGRTVDYDHVSKTVDGEFTRAIDAPGVTCRSCRKFRDCLSCNARVRLPRKRCAWCRANYAAKRQRKEPRRG